jgi:hypothetical protein
MAIISQTVNRFKERDKIAKSNKRTHQTLVLMLIGEQDVKSTATVKVK